MLTSATTDSLQTPLGVARRRCLQPVALAAAAFLCAAASASAADWAVDSDQDTNTSSNVCSSTPTGTCTLRAAVAAANNGDRIFFVPGSYTVTLGSELLIDHNLTIEGLPDEGVRLSGGNTTRIFRSTGGTVVMRDLVLEDGYNTDRGGAVLVHLSGGITFERVTFRDNVVDSTSSGGGGAVATVSSAAMECFDCLFEGNSALGGASGGAYFHTADAPSEIQRSTFVDNEATGNGGAIYSEGIVIVYNSSLIGNRSVGIGGAGYAAPGANLNFAVSSFAENVRPGGIARGGAQIASGGEVGSGGNGILGVFASIIQALEQSGISACSGGTNLQFFGTLSNDPSCLGTDSLPAQPTGLITELIEGPVVPYLRPSVQSPAIDAFAQLTFTCSSLLDTLEDQRGLPRGVDGDGDGNADCDLGAFEGQWFFADGFEDGDTSSWTPPTP